MSSLPIPVMSATLMRAPGPIEPDVEAPGYFAPYFEITLDRDPRRTWRVRRRGSPQKPGARRGCHCTTCGAAGHNSRSKEFHPKVAP